MLFYRLTLLFVQYLVPVVIITVVYMRMALRLWGSHAPGNAQDSRDANLMRNKKKVRARRINDKIILLFNNDVIEYRDDIIIWSRLVNNYNNIIIIITPLVYYQQLRTIADNMSQFIDHRKLRRLGSSKVIKYNQNHCYTRWRKSFTVGKVLESLYSYKNRLYHHKLT